MMEKKTPYAAIQYIRKSIGYDEGENNGLSALSISYLNTHKSHRKMGLAKKMISDVEKMAWFNDYKLLCGIGIPLEKGFCVYNKTMQEMGFYLDYEKRSHKGGYAEYDPLSGVVDLAIFYSRLGFDIYPMGESFIIERKVDCGIPSKKQEMFLKAAKSKLDEETILFQK
jgi:GNAT superfamily N-acetyltransferase